MKNTSGSSGLRKAFQWSVVKRALIMSAIVGTLLVGIHHGLCVCSGDFSYTCLCQSALTFLVPYAVSTISSVLAMSEFPG